MTSPDPKIVTTFMTKKEHEDAGFVAFEPVSYPVNNVTTGVPIDYPIHRNITKPIRISPDKFSLGIWIFSTNKDKTLARLDGISRDGFIQLIYQMGYYKRYRVDNTFQYIQEKENIIRAVEVSQIRDDVSDYIQNSESIMTKWDEIPFIASIEQQKETFLRNSPSLFNDALLGHLPNHEKPILHDTDKEMFFLFKNCIVKVTEEKVHIIEYVDMKNVCIWKDHINNRSYNYALDYEMAQFSSFINNVASNEADRIAAIRSATGYLLHNFSSPTTARAVIAYDEQIAGRREPAGGTGKGILNQAIGKLRNTAIIDGKKIKDDNQFSYQMVNERTQIISFDDVRPDFDFLTLNSNLTTGWQIERKRVDAFRFSPQGNPKTYITSNTILRAEGTTAKRRQFIIEFSPYYSRLVAQDIEPIIATHGGMFFTDWSDKEWDRFFTFMLNCAKYYLANGLQFYKLRAVAENKLKQTTSDDFSEWINKQSIELNKAHNLSEWFDDFKAIYYGNDSDFKQRTFNNWLKSFALTKSWILENKRSNGKSIGIFKAKEI